MVSWYEWQDVLEKFVSCLFTGEIMRNADHRQHKDTRANELTWYFIFYQFYMFIHVYVYTLKVHYILCWLCES